MTAAQASQSARPRAVHAQGFTSFSVACDMLGAVQEVAGLLWNDTGGAEPPRADGRLMRSGSIGAPAVPDASAAVTHAAAPPAADSRGDVKMAAAAAGGPGLTEDGDAAFS